MMKLNVKIAMLLKSVVNQAYLEVGADLNFKQKSQIQTNAIKVLLTALKGIKGSSESGSSLLIQPHFLITTDKGGKSIVSIAPEEITEELMVRLEVSFKDRKPHAAFYRALGPFTGGDKADMAGFHFPEGVEALAKELKSIIPLFRLESPKLGTDKVSLVLPVTLTEAFEKQLSSKLVVENRSADGLHFSIFLKSFSPIIDGSELEGRLLDLASRKGGETVRVANAEMTKSAALSQATVKAPKHLAGFGSMLHHWIQAYGRDAEKIINDLVSKNLPKLAAAIKVITAECIQYSFSTVIKANQPERACAFGVELVEGSSLDALLQNFRESIGVSAMTRDAKTTCLYHATLGTSNLQPAWLEEGAAKMVEGVGVLRSASCEGGASGEACAVVRDSQPTLG